MQRLKSFGEESDLVVEPIYGTKYKMEKIPEELIQEWATTMPKEDELLDYPPPNTFVPENIPTSKKAEKPDESERHTPPNLTQLHPTSPNHTQPHPTSTTLTQCHPLSLTSPDLTQPHPTSPNLT